MRNIIFAVGVGVLIACAASKIAAQAKPRYISVNGLAECQSIYASTAPLAGCMGNSGSALLVLNPDGSVTWTSPQ